ncbi:trypsin II-P29 [Musca domestica]|uniref:Trypsin II-P29 n=1 Tax=Musca domestica TaxID=7370 RepID=A0A9J7CM62_MUSDO|nr:trypsin II-P29 [Musca domestica]
MKAFALVVLFAAVACATPSIASLGKLLHDRLTGPAVDINPFIIDGENAAEKSAPYLVSLSASKLVAAHSCAGAIIGKEWVLTAAHCVNELNQLAGSAVGLTVYAGLTDRSNEDKAQIRTIDFAFNHKQFTGAEGSDDIALLHVTPAFEFGVNVKAAALPYRQEQFDGQSSANYGWGLDDAEGTMYVKDLKVAKSDVLSAAECQEALPSDAPVSSKQICVRVAACYGDGGSPLVVEREGNVAELVGITSWGYMPCGYNNRPTVYTAVSEYVDWINEVQWAYYVLN